MQRTMKHDIIRTKTNFDYSRTLNSNNSTIYPFTVKIYRIFVL